MENFIIGSVIAIVVLLIVLWAIKKCTKKEDIKLSTRSDDPQADEIVQKEMADNREKIMQRVLGIGESLPDLSEMVSFIAKGGQVRKHFSGPDSLISIIAGKLPNDEIGIFALMRGDRHRIKQYVDYHWVTRRCSIFPDCAEQIAEIIVRREKDSLAEEIRQKLSEIFTGYRYRLINDLQSQSIRHRVGKFTKSPFSEKFFDRSENFSYHDETFSVTLFSDTSVDYGDDRPDHSVTKDSVRDFGKIQKLHLKHNRTYMRDRIASVFSSDETYAEFNHWLQAKLGTRRDLIRSLEQTINFWTYIQGDLFQPNLNVTVGKDKIKVIVCLGEALTFLENVYEPGEFYAMVGEYLLAFLQRVWKDNDAGWEISAPEGFGLMEYNGEPRGDEREFATYQYQLTYRNSEDQ